jgi:Fe-S cluster biogenesis protein NfuA
MFAGCRGADQVLSREVLPLTIFHCSLRKSGVSPKALVLPNIHLIFKKSMANNREKTEKKIEELLEKVRPYIQMHGGDVQFKSFKEGVAELDIYGACTHCSLADMTYNNLIAGLLKQDVPEVREIILNKKV